MLGTFNEYFKTNNCAKSLDFQINFHRSVTMTRGSHLEVLLGKGVLKICSKLQENPCRSAIHFLL